LKTLSADRFSRQGSPIGAMNTEALTTMSTATIAQPTITPREQRERVLALAGAVHAYFGQFLVEGATGRYLVAQHDHIWACDCADRRYHPRPRFRCAHAHAVEYARAHGLVNGGFEAGYSAWSEQTARPITNAEFLVLINAGE
jgi:hypothetical protein